MMRKTIVSTPLRVAAILGASLAIGTSRAIPGFSRTIDPNIPKYLKENMPDWDRRTRKRYLDRAFDRATNRHNASMNRKRRLAAKSSEPVALQAVVNKMTNWQRNQWAKAGYPSERAGEFSQAKRSG